MIVSRLEDLTAYELNKAGGDTVVVYNARKYIVGHRLDLSFNKNFQIGLTEMAVYGGEGRDFEIFVQSNHYVIKKINQYYHETPAGEILALFNSVGLLEVAMNSGNAADLLGLSSNSSVRVKFAEKVEVKKPASKKKSR